MTFVITTAVVVALIGSAMIGGVFFAFSSFVMKALARMPAAEGIAAMQSINVVVLNRSFLGLFIGTAVLSLLVGVLTATGWGTPSAPWWIAGALAYVLGTFGVTARGNVPLNDQLAAVSANDSGSAAFWQHYLDRWTLLNTVRAAAATVAAVLFTVGL